MKNLQAWHRESRHRVVTWLSASNTLGGAVFASRHCKRWNCSNLRGLKLQEQHSNNWDEGGSIEPLSHWASDPHLFQEDPPWPAWTIRPFTDIRLWRRRNLHAELFFSAFGNRPIRRYRGVCFVPFQPAGVGVPLVVLYHWYVPWYSTTTGRNDHEARPTSYLGQIYS